MNTHPDDPIDQWVAEINREYTPPFDLPDLTVIRNQWLFEASLPLRQNVLARLIEQDFAARPPTDDLRRLADYVHLLGLERVEDAPAELILAEYRYRQRIGQDPDQSGYENYAEFDRFLALAADLPRTPATPPPAPSSPAPAAAPAPELAPPARPPAVATRRIFSWPRAIAAVALVLVAAGLAVWGCIKDDHTPGGKTNDDTKSAPRSSPLPPTLTVRLSERETLVLRLIDPAAQQDKGRFTMGSTAAQRTLLKGLEWKVSADEAAHEVTLRKPFYMGVTEVTRGQYHAFLRATGTKSEAEATNTGGNGWDEVTKSFPGDRKYSWHNPGFPQSDAHPAVLVSWNDGRDFARWLTDAAAVARQVSDQLGVRAWAAELPSEARWEYACRAGSTGLFSFDDSIPTARDGKELAREYGKRLVGHGNVADGLMMVKLGYTADNWFGAVESDEHLFTAPVGTWQPNAFGLRDMHGNVWEWCQDWYGPPSDLGDVDPIRTIATGEGKRVLRGGSWRHQPLTHYRSAYRHKDAPGEAWCDIGFRVCIVVEP